MPSAESTFFIDTGFHLAYKFESEANHQEARAIITRIQVLFHHPTFITTDLVVCETLNFIHCKDGGSRARKQQLAVEMGQDIIAFNEIATITPEMFFEAWKLYQEKLREGFDWGFVDCSSFIFIREIRKGKYSPNQRTIKNVLAFDHDFVEAQAYFGFTVVRLNTLPS